MSENFSKISKLDNGLLIFMKLRTNLVLYIKSYAKGFLVCLASRKSRKTGKIPGIYSDREKTPGIFLKTENIRITLKSP